MLRKTTTVLALGFASIAVSPGLQAQQAGTGLYIYGAVANSSAKFDRAQLDSNLRAAGATGVNSTLDERFMGVKAQVGYKFQPNLAIEGGWVNLGRFNYDAAITNVAGGFVKTDIKASGFNVALVNTWPVNADFAFFGKIGALRAKTEIDVRQAVGIAPTAIEARANRWAPDLGAGFTIAFSPQGAFRVEYERFFRVGASNTTARPDIDLLSLGITYSFR